MQANAKVEDSISTEFLVDPLVKAVYNKEDDYFNLVVMAPWPKMQAEGGPRPFTTFMEGVKQCYDDEDLAGSSPNVFLYDRKFLHVTIATCCTNHKRHAGRDYEKWKRDFCHVVKSAAQRCTWPREKLRLEYESTKLTAKAGILLWKETTGGIAAMREAILDEARTQMMPLHHIPDIVHTTFLRYHKVPETSFGTVQQSFQNYVLPHAARVFESGLDLDKVLVVTETTPYNLVSKDDVHLCVNLVR